MILDPSTLTFRGDDSCSILLKEEIIKLLFFLIQVVKHFHLPAHSLPSARGMGEPLTGRVVAESGVTFDGSAIGAESSRS